MYAHLLTCHSASSASTTTLSADAEKRGVEEDEDDETRSLAGGKMSASAPSTPPTSSQLLSPLLSRFPCNECNFRWGWFFTDNFSLNEDRKLIFISFDRGDSGLQNDYQYIF